MKLLPCPFCGTHRTKLVRWPITPENFGAEIRCECGCRGPAGFGKSFIPMAADLWNRREHSAARIKRLEEELTDTKNKHAVLVADVVLDDDRAERIKRLEDRIARAATAFFRDGSDASVASRMLAILEEERNKK